jgi:predicted metal-binding membrane protein
VILFLVGLGGFATIVLLAMVLPRVAGTLVFCFFATGCVQCDRNGDPASAVALLLQGCVFAWVLFDMGRLKRDETMRAKATHAPPEVMP